VLFALVRGERRGQHDAGVVDEDVGAAEFLLYALGGGDDRVAVGDVGLDGDRAVAGSAAMPEDAPVMTATRPEWSVVLMETTVPGDRAP
jgi:hypothetical protein